MVEKQKKQKLEIDDQIYEALKKAIDQLEHTEEE